MMTQTCCTKCLSKNRKCVVTKMRVNYKSMKNSDIIQNKRKLKKMHSDNQKKTNFFNLILKTEW